MVQLGDKVRDVVTGLEGVVIGMTTWLTGCDQAIIQPGIVNKETGKVSDGSWFDVHRLEVIKKQAVVLPKDQQGGPPLFY